MDGYKLEHIPQKIGSRLKVTMKPSSIYLLPEAGIHMERMYNERVHAKDKMFEYQQMKQKMDVEDPYIDNNIAKYLQ